MIINFSTRSAARWLRTLLIGVLAWPSVSYSTPVQLNAPTSERQSLVKGNGAEPASLDPAMVRSGFPEEAILYDLFEGLVAEDSQGNLIAAQALRWEVSADGLQWRFFLRPNLTWSNGDPLVAGDFVYSWRRLLDPSLASPNAELVLEAGINNAQSIYAGALNSSELGVSTQGDHILAVTLERPVPYFLQLISQRAFAPVNPKVVEQYGKSWASVGTLVSNGAYRLTNWVANERIDAERNAHYWDDRHSQIARVTYLPIASLQQERQRFDAGELQMTNRVLVDGEQKLNRVSHGRVWGLPLLGTYLYTFNLKRPELSDVRVRQALSMAIDKEALFSHQAGQRDTAAWSLLPLMPNYQPLAVSYAKQPLGARQLLAKSMLEQAGFHAQTPLKLTITYNQGENHKKIAQQIAQSWQQIGVQVSLEGLPWSSYQMAKDNGDFMVARSFLFGDYVEPSAMLNTFRCQDLRNESGYCNEQFDALLAHARQSLDEGRRQHLYQQAEQLLLTDSPVIPLYHYTQLRLVDPALRGLPERHLKGMIASKDLYFESGKSSK